MLAIHVKITLAPESTSARDRIRMPQDCRLLRVAQIFPERRSICEVLARSARLKDGPAPLGIVFNFRRRMN
jgi:hypothetical protein